MIMWETQINIWKLRVKYLRLKDVIKLYHNPRPFQKDLVRLINQWGKAKKTIIEIGCETGVTSFLLHASFDKTLLDNNPEAIELAKKAFTKAGGRATFVTGDMFSMPFRDKSFDIVFNAGVLEHFNKKERIAALKEYARVLKDDGLMIIAFPNHWSIPYRLIYIIRRILGKWEYPSEHKLYDLKEEISANRLILRERVVLSKEEVFRRLEFMRILLLIGKVLDRLFNFEGYLTTLIIAKNQ